jgi:hypothetical protein
MSNIKDRAGKIRDLMRDETFRDVMQGVRTEQVGVFLSSNATIEDIEEAHQIVVALDKIEAYMRTVLNDEAVYDKKNT